MNITFIGGGSLRLLPILRGVMKTAPTALNGSTLRFYDLNTERAADVACLVQKAPEFRNLTDCRVSVPKNAEEAFSGTDLVYVTMGVRKEPQITLSAYACSEHGFFSTDQLTLTGAFLSAKLGPVILDIAHQMEKYCPQALMLIFANPVAVYCNMVNRFTGIRALGICGGFNNHRWDLSRLCGQDAFDPDWDVVAAGVNHLSFILRGSYRGEDLYGEVMPRILNEKWQNMFANTNGVLEAAMDFLYALYKKYNVLVFSTEFDGLFHLFPEEIVQIFRSQLPDKSKFDPAAASQSWSSSATERFSRFHNAACNAESLDWKNIEPDLFGISETDITIPILKAISGIEKMRIVAADVNRGVLNSLPDEAAVEYTMDFFQNTITPVENQFIPSPFKGLISALSEFQTLLAEAAAKQDGKLFASALDAYPVKQFTSDKREAVRKLFDIYRADLNSEMRKAEIFFN